MAEVLNGIRRGWLRYEPWSEQARVRARPPQIDTILNLSNAVPRMGGGTMKQAIYIPPIPASLELGQISTMYESVEASAAIATGVGAGGSGFITVDGFVRLCSSFGVATVQPAKDPHAPFNSPLGWSDCSGPCMLALAMARSEQWSLHALGYN